LILISSIILIALSSALLVLIFFMDIEKSFSGLRFRTFKSLLLNSSQEYFFLLEKSIYKKLPVLEKFLGSAYFFSFIFPSVLIFISLFFLTVYLTNSTYGVFLALFFSLAYISRIFLHLSVSYRERVLSQLNRLCLSIRNYLSTGMTLDKAIIESVKYKPEKPVGFLLTAFIKLSESDLIEKFPFWFSSMEKHFFIPELSNSRQLLELELKYNYNQEEAFLNTAKYIQQKEKRIKKQKNTLNIAFLILDFMVMAFLGLLFFVIPNLSINLNTNWWLSLERPCVVFQSGSVIAFAYLIAVVFACRRQF
jgi:hypothetical protein